MTTAYAPPEPPNIMIEMMNADELATALRYHNWRYFALNKPSISDEAFDRIARRLAALDPKHPALSELIGSGQGEKVAHDAPMLSLDKCYSEEDF